MMDTPGRSSGESVGGGLCNLNLLKIETRNTYVHIEMGEIHLYILREAMFYFQRENVHLSSLN